MSRTISGPSTERCAAAIALACALLAGCGAPERAAPPATRNLLATPTEVAVAPDTLDPLRALGYADDGGGERRALTLC